MQRECRRDFIDAFDAELIADSLRTALLVEPSEATAERHLAAMRSAVAQLARADQQRVTERRNRRARIRVVWAAGVSSLALAVSGMAAAGALPGIAQHDAARVAAIVHVHVPDTAAKVAPAAPPVVAHAPIRRVAAALPVAVHLPVPATVKPAPVHVSAPPAPPSHAPAATAPKKTKAQVPTANPPHVKQPGHKKNGHWKRHHHKHKKKHQQGSTPPTTKEPTAFGPKNG